MSPKMVPDWVGYLRFRDLFADVMDLRFYTPEWLDGEILTGQALFWRSENAAIVAEIRTYPTGAQDVHGIVAAGDLDEILGELIPQAEAWGRANGCCGAIIESREGWARALKGSGYAPYQQAVRKEF